MPGAAGGVFLFFQPKGELFLGHAALDKALERVAADLKQALRLAESLLQQTCGIGGGIDAGSAGAVFEPDFGVGRKWNGKSHGLLVRAHTVYRLLRLGLKGESANSAHKEAADGEIRGFNPGQARDVREGGSGQRIKCRGLKKEGGNLLRGIPPTKKASAPVQRRSPLGSVNSLTFIGKEQHSLLWQNNIDPFQKIKRIVHKKIFS
jgi:hypothetical protein